MRKSLLIATTILFVCGMFALALDITMDAERDDFYNTLTSPDDGYIYLDYTSWGTGSLPDDNIDLSAFAWFAWDSTYLYAYFEVTDDYIFLNNTTTYENDGVELKIDPDPSYIDETATGVAAYRLHAWGADDASEPDAVQNIDSGEAGVWPHEIVEFEDYARTEVATDERNGYNLEFRIPFETMVVGDDRFIVPGIGIEMGMAVNVLDNDDVGRDHVLRWASDMNDLVWNEPTRHGTVTFLEGNKVQLSTVNAITGVDTLTIDFTPPVTQVETNPAQAPVEFNLAQNYPNPFNPTTNIEFSLPAASEVTLTVYDMLGKEVATLVNDVKSAGTHSVTFDGSNLTSGVYFYKLATGSDVQMNKMMLIK